MIKDDLKVLEGNLTRDEFLGFLKGYYILRCLDHQAAPLQEEKPPLVKAIQRDSSGGEISEALEKLSATRRGQT